MKSITPDSRPHRGSTLVEAVIAVGVLAVAIPMVFGVLAGSGKSGLSSQAETRSAWMVSACMDEIRASREGRPQYFSSTVTGQTFPPAGRVWALAFSVDGKLIGKLDKAPYDSGVRTLSGQTVRYIAAMSGVKEATTSGPNPMLRIDITLEYPAIQKAAKREKLDFHTRIP
jgi:type II secretory pathway pseudopilin PulG